MWIKVNNYDCCTTIGYQILQFHETQKSIVDLKEFYKSAKAFHCWFLLEKRFVLISIITLATSSSIKIWLIVERVSRYL